MKFDKYMYYNTNIQVERLEGSDKAENLMSFKGNIIVIQG